MQSGNQPVSANLRIAHLDKLAKGEEEIKKEKKANYLPFIIIGVSVIVVISLILYYENELEKERKKNQAKK